MINDIYHTIGADLTVGPTGDLLPVAGTTRGTQRVLRRLITPASDYIWHPSYGGGLGLMVGQPTDALTITGLIRAQLSQEAVVSQIPAPSVAIEPTATGTNTVNVLYVDADTGETQALPLPN